MDSNQLVVSPEEGSDALNTAASCLQAYLKRYGRAGRPYEVLSFLASATLERLEHGKVPKFKNVSLQDAVMGEMGKDPSAWVSPIWKKLVTEILPAIQDHIEGFAREREYEYYPWVSKTDSTGGSGNQTLYFLIARKVIPSEVGQQLLNADIFYLPAIKITPSWWARWLFNKDYSAQGWRKALYVWVPLVWMLIMGSLGWLLWLELSNGRTPLSARELIFLLFSIGIWIYCRHVMRQFFQLVDDRIVLAPDHLVGFREFGVCLELFRENSKDKFSPRILKLTKYTAECPDCGAEVQLDRGEPDFPRRVIGRCLESPREHIYSFDRVTKTGMKLRP